MSFLTPTFLVGLAGMGLPVLIHLLTRDRVRRVEFSTLRFFVKTSGRVLRRKRFQEMLLLLLRAVVCGLLAVAFARPLLEDDNGDLPVVHARRARVVLVDVSASMARGDAPEALRNAARDALAELSAGTDAVAVLTFAENVTIEAPLARDFARAERAVEDLAPTEGATNIAQALGWGDAQLRRARADRRDVVLISDLQRTGWADFKADFKLTPGVQLDVRPITPDPPGPPVAVLACSFPETAVLDREPQTITVQLINYDPQPAQGVNVALKLGGNTATREVNLRGGGTAATTFRRVFDSPGDNPGTIELAGRPAFYFNARVIPRIQVVLIDGGMNAGRASDAAFFVETALAPGTDVASPFETRVRSAVAVAASDLADTRVAIVVDAGRIAPAAAKALRGLLARGGGVLLMPGEGTDPAAFNATFGELAPCRLREVRTGRMLRAGGFGASLASIDFQHPIFEVFSHPRHGDLSLPKFLRYWDVTDSQLSQVLAKFDDNRPAVLARNVGGGVVMMLAACPDPAWTDFARQTTFLPYVWQTVKYLAARTERKTTYVVGESLPAPEGHTLIGPDGKADETGRFAARRAGFYTLKGPDGQDAATYAVNRSPAEADPATVAADEIVQAVERTGQEALAAAGQSDEGEGPRSDDRGLWWWVIVAVAVLLVAELLLGNKTLRH